MPKLPTCCWGQIEPKLKGLLGGRTVYKFILQARWEGQRSLENRSSLGFQF